MSESGLYHDLLTEGYVEDYMATEVFTSEPDTPVNELARLMFQKKIHRVIIVEQGTLKPVGIVTTFDILKLMAEVSSTRELIA